MAIPEKPITREEQYLDAIAKNRSRGLPNPITRREQYLNQIANNGGGDSTGNAIEVIDGGENIPEACEENEGRVFIYVGSTYEQFIYGNMYACWPHGENIYAWFEITPNYIQDLDDLPDPEQYADFLEDTVIWAYDSNSNTVNPYKITWVESEEAHQWLKVSPNGGGTSDGAIIVHDLSELPIPTEELNGKIALFVNANFNFEGGRLECYPLVCFTIPSEEPGAESMSMWTPFTLNGCLDIDFSGFIDWSQYPQYFDPQLAEAAGGNIEYLADSNGYYNAGRYYRYGLIGNTCPVWLDALLPRADYALHEAGGSSEDGPFVVGQAVSQWDDAQHIVLTLEMYKVIDDIFTKNITIDDVLPVEALHLSDEWEAAISDIWIESGHVVSKSGDTQITTPLYYIDSSDLSLTASLTLGQAKISIVAPGISMQGKQLMLKIRYNETFTRNVK